MSVVKNLLVLIRRLRKGGGAVLRRVEIYWLRNAGSMKSMRLQSNMLTFSFQWLAFQIAFVGGKYVCDIAGERNVRL